MWKSITLLPFSLPDGLISVLGDSAMASAMVCLRCSSSISELLCWLGEFSGQLPQLTSSRFDAWSKVPVDNNKLDNEVG